MTQILAYNKQTNIRFNGKRHLDAHIHRHRTSVMIPKLLRVQDVKLIWCLKLLHFATNFVVILSLSVCPSLDLLTMFIFISVAPSSHEYSLIHLIAEHEHTKQCMHK